MWGIERMIITQCSLLSVDFPFFFLHLFSLFTLGFPSSDWSRMARLTSHRLFIGFLRGNSHRYRKLTRKEKKKRLSNIIRSPAYNNGSFTSVYSRNRCCFKLKWFNDVEFLESSTGSFFTLANKIFKKI